MNLLEPALWAILGGVFLEVFHWYSLREHPHFPTFARTFRYWFVTLLFILFGGVATVLLVDAEGNISNLNAFALGFSLPSVAHKFADLAPPVAIAGSGDTGIPSMRGFLTGKG